MDFTIKKRKSIEKTEVVNPCFKALKILDMHGSKAILEYKRLDAQDIDHKVGSPDIQVYVEVDGVLHVIMAECKSPKGKLRTSQKKYRSKYKHLSNVHYIEVRKVSDLMNKIEELTKFFENMLNSI